VVDGAILSAGRNCLLGANASWLGIRLVDLDVAVQFRGNGQTDGTNGVIVPIVKTNPAVFFGLQPE
jgi:hypothetical protein